MPVARIRQSGLAPFFAPPCWPLAAGFIFSLTRFKSAQIEFTEEEKNARIAQGISRL